MSHILIADDDEFLTSICSKTFEQAGYRTSTANDGHQVIEQLNREKPDLVLLDLMLPGIDGIGVLKFIRSRKELEGLPVFIVSNSTYFSGMVQDAWSEGATKFIRKGEFSPKGLVDEVRKTIPPTTDTSPPANKIAPATSPPMQKEHKRTEDKKQGNPQPKEEKSKSRTALIADDDRTIHSVLVYFLGQAGYTIESAFNGQEALEMARQKPPEVLILDVTMPIKDGFETLKEWRDDAALRHIPVIMLTASQNEENQGKAMGAGANHYLTKPFSPQTLVKIANELAES